MPGHAVCAAWQRAAGACAAARGEQCGGARSAPQARARVRVCSAVCKSVRVRVPLMQWAELAADPPERP